jgi:hypothetical protein
MDEDIKHLAKYWFHIETGNCGPGDPRERCPEWPIDGFEEFDVGVQGTSCGSRFAWAQSKAHRVTFAGRDLAELDKVLTAFVRGLLTAAKGPHNG